MDAIKKLRGLKGATTTTTKAAASSSSHGGGGRRNSHHPNVSIADEKKKIAASRRTNHALHERLEEVLVFEILQDGGQKYRNDLNLRGLYKYVLASITNRNAAKQARQQENIIRATAVASTTVTTFTTPPPPPTTTTTTTTKTLSHPNEGKNAQRGDTTTMSNSPTTTPPTKVIRRSRAHSVVEMTSNDASYWEADADARLGGVGGQEPNTTNVVTFRERLGGYLHPRDMRKLVIPFSATNKPDIIVRRHVMLLNFDPLRAIILRDRLLVLVPDGADSLLFRLEQKVRGTSDDMLAEFAETKEAIERANDEDAAPISGSSTMFGRQSGNHNAASTERPSLVATPLPEVSEKEDDSPLPEVSEKEDDSNVEEENNEEWDEIQGRQWFDLPFELQCLDAVLQCATELLSDDTKELKEAVQYYMQHGVQPKQAHRGEDPRAVIRVLDDALKEMMSRVKCFETSISKCLDEEEDMALMNLSRLLTHPERFIQPVSQNVLEEESDEPELILEAHLQDAMALADIVGLLQGQIETASELLDRKVDTARNKILEVNVIFMVAAMCLQAIHAVKAIFGMNLNSYIQEKPHLFVIVTFTALTGALCIFGFTVYILVKTKTIQW